MPLRKRMQSLVESLRFQHTITFFIILNALVLGLQTRPSHDTLNQIYQVLDRLCLLVFVVELLIKIFVYRLKFFRNGWNLFDFIVVSVSLAPLPDELSIIRVFRVFRTFRLVTHMPNMKRVIAGMLSAIPGVGSALGLLSVFFYVFAVLTTMLFGQSFPDWFGSLSVSLFTLFQIMTLESWSMGIVRPVMESNPYAWMLFIPFIIITTFTVLNLFIGVIVDAMATSHDSEEEIQEVRVLVERVERLELSAQKREARLLEGMAELKASMQHLNERIDR
ncbi:ion transporter [Magnetococcales bacterium HHB-1]